MRPDKIKAFTSRMQNKFFATMWPYGTQSEVHGMTDKAFHMVCGCPAVLLLSLCLSVSLSLCLCLFVSVSLFVSLPVCVLHRF